MTNAFGHEIQENVKTTVLGDWTAAKHVNIYHNNIRVTMLCNIYIDCLCCSSLCMTKTNRQYCIRIYAFAYYYNIIARTMIFSLWCVLSFVSVWDVLSIPSTWMPIVQPVSWRYFDNYLFDSLFKYSSICLYRTHTGIIVIIWVN